MRLNRYILCLCLVFLGAGIQADRVYAQKPGSPETSINALDYRYQQFGEPLFFADSVKFRNRLYNILSTSLESDWENSLKFDQPKLGFSSRLAFGYRLTPVHAVEANFLYSNVSSRHAFGVDLDWVMNLNNFATRKDAHNRFEVLYFAGASYRQSKMSAFGANTGLRVQWNPGINAGLFIEPKLSVLSNPYSSYAFSTVPSVSFGLTVRYHQPKYYLWDYLTPVALKTNLLYDAVTGVNFGIEAPIRDRWSVAFDWVCPWWSNYDNQKFFQIMSGSLEGRYWFGNREDKYQLTGWFAGLAVGGGIYDVMLKPLNGVQGEFSTVGAVGGYAHAINKAGILRMEYELGLGWLGTDYVKYWWDGFDYTLTAPSPQSWHTNWFGPVKAQVSLVYMLKIRSKVSGRK